MPHRILLLSFIIFLAASQFALSQHSKSSQFIFLDSLFSKDSYQVEFLGIEKKTAVVQSTGSVKVKHQAGVITFTTADEKLKFFESLIIDCQNEMVVFKNDTLPLLDEVFMPATCPFGEWNGYTWLKTISNTGDNDVIIIDKQTRRSTQVDFGNVKNTNKILLRINCKELEQGRTKTQFSVSCYLY